MRSNELPELFYVGRRPMPVGPHGFDLPRSPDCVRDVAEPRRAGLHSVGGPGDGPYGGDEPRSGEPRADGPRRAGTARRGADVPRNALDRLRSHDRLESIARLRAAARALDDVDVAGWDDSALTDHLAEISASLCELDAQLSRVAEAVRARGFRISEPLAA